MKSMQKPIKTVVNAAVIAVMASAANAGSFSLYTESSPAAIGNYAAGIAAEAADASTGWYNPAGLPLIRSKEAVFGAVGIFPSIKLHGLSTFNTAGLPTYQQTFDGIKTSKPGYVPSFHSAIPLGENATFGFSVVAPFGLATQWNRQGRVRYAATTSNLLTSNFSPEIGAKLTEKFSVGAGIDLQYSRVRFNQVLGSPALMHAFGVEPSLLDSLSYNRGQSFGVGFHAGVLGMFYDNHTRVGFNYQSQVRHRFNGYSRLQGRLANLSPILTPLAVLESNPDALYWSNSLASNTIIFPEVATLSLYQDVTDRFAFLASAVFTGWRSLKTLELDRVAAYAPFPANGQILANSVTTENYHNAWRFAIGGNYHVNEKLMMRVGGGFDQTPTRKVYRDIRVPDSNRAAASIGAHYQARPSLGVDIGYTRLFGIEHAKINKTAPVGSSSTYNVNAGIKSHADLVGIQAVWTLDQPVPVTTK